jgi:hypothetical protein
VLAELAELIANTLNASNPNNWGTYTVPGYVSAETCLDPETVMTSTKKRLFIMPLFTGYSEDGTLKRGRVQSTQANLQLGITLLIPFQEFSKTDVSDWQEVKKILELREKLDLFVMRTKWSDYDFVSADPQPPVEIELQQRNFFSSTEFTFTTQVC